MLTYWTAGISGWTWVDAIKKKEKKQTIGPVLTYLISGILNTPVHSPYLYRMSQNNVCTFIELLIHKLHFSKLATFECLNEATEELCRHIVAHILVDSCSFHSQRWAKSRWGVLALV